MSRYQSPCAVAGFVVLAASLAGQTPSPVTVHGQAYDSLIRGPLVGATVWLRDVNRSAFTDAKGRFTLDSVPPGTHVVILSDQDLEDVGIPEIATAVTVAPGESRDVSLVTPSIGTLWRHLCSGAALGRDSAIVFGVVKDADTDSLLAGAAVTADWLGFGPGDSSRTRILELTATAITDGTGSYRICGGRLSSAAHVQARAGAGVSGVIELSPGPRGILRQDFSVSRTAGAVMDSGNGRAEIEGHVVGPGRRAVAEAQVDVGHARVARSKSDGSFVLSGLPAGTQELHVRAIGYAETRQVVNLRTGDTSHVSVELQARLDLDTLQVLAQTRAARQMADFEQRRKTGLAYTMTEDEVKRHPSIRTLFQAIPSATVTGRSEREFSVLLPAFGSLRRGNCVANVYVDGVRSDFEEVGSLSIDDVAAVEVYVRAAEVPPEFINVSNGCGVILLWLKRMR